MTSKEFFRLILRYFLQGLLLTAPLGITVFVLFKALEFIDGIVPFRIPGLGLLTLVAGITLIGFVGSTFIAKPLLAFFDDLISRAPLIKILYSAIKDFLEALVGKKKKFTEPVLVKVYEGTGLMKLGFVTSRDLSILGLGEDYVAVYLPHSYNFSGNLFFVPVKNVIPVQGNISADIMKYVITAGVTSLDEISQDGKKQNTNDMQQKPLT
ncbi:MAG TPA: DUF502 domain-containing protein [Bacteroidales bacterium]|nr:DUF502 domain-containing protein [Bacteroidales bacterium]HSA44197.1 DUF502 domain-containing protein [Bacteroidales bacterium]